MFEVLDFNNMDDLGTQERTKRNRHSSTEHTHRKTENVRLSQQDLPLPRRDGTCVYKVKNEVKPTDDSEAIPCLKPHNLQTLSGKYDETDSSYLRISDGICHGEMMATKQRRILLSRTSDKLLGKGRRISEEKIPNIALIGSGGGVRAMTAMSSVFCTLYDEKLLQYILYVAGLSGSAWYLSTLYSHKDWPKVHPEIIHAEIKIQVLNNLFDTFNEILKASGTWFSKIILEQKPTNITELFGLSLCSNLIPDRFQSKWSNQRDKVKDGKVPFPILSCIHAKCDSTAKDFHEWVEMSPFEAAIPKYGIGLDVRLFGSEFDRGNLTKAKEELPLYYINGICGSAFTIIKEELDFHRKDDRDDCNDNVDGIVQSEKSRIDNVEVVEANDLVNSPIITEDGKEITNNLSDVTYGKEKTMADALENVSLSTSDMTDEPRFQRIRNECPGWLKDFMSKTLQTYARQISYEDDDIEIDGCFDDALSYIKSLLKRTFLESRDYRAAMLNNPLKNLSFIENYPGCKTNIDGIFSRIFEKDEENQQMCLVDAGFAFNSPYPIVLRSPRSVDLILSFDFTDRGSVNGDPFKEIQLAKIWAELHNIKFPPVPKFDPSEEVQELYILEDENDPFCPVIMHFVLVNKDFKIFSSPGIRRRTAEECRFANFDLFKDSCPYNSQNFQYTDEQFDRLSELVRFNILNNKEKIKEQIQKATYRRAKLMEQSLS